MSHKDAKDLANLLDENALGNLIKKAVLGEGLVGSTTVIPILFFGFAERFGFSSANKLAAWACENTENRYVPFGSGRTRAKNYRQWLLEEESKLVVRAKNEAMDQLVHARKQKERRFESDTHKTEKIRADGSRATFFKTISELTPVERIQEIIKFDVPLESVPFDQLEITEEIVNSLNSIFNIKLVGMIGNRKKGPWVQVRKWLSNP